MKILREDMNNHFSQIMLMIQQNPKLYLVKPEILEKINEIYTLFFIYISNLLLLLGIQLIQEGTAGMLIYYEVLAGKYLHLSSLFLSFLLRI